MKFSLKCLKALLLVSIITLGTTYAQSEIVVNGQIFGAKDGTPIRLVRMEKRFDKMQIDSGVIAGGAFSLKGTLNGPTIVHLRIGKGEINSKGNPKAWASIPMMLDRGKVKIEVVHLDSIPLEYNDQGPVSLDKRNVTIEGAGSVQNQYEEYLTAIRESEFKVWQADRTASAYFMSGGAQLDSLSKLHFKEKVEEMKRDSVANLFMRAHPNYPISAWIGLQQAQKQFAYTTTQLREMTSMLQDNPDHTRYQRILEEVEKNKDYVLHLPFGELEAESSTGQSVAMASLVGKGKYTLIDFWASWCGPCRSAIPHVRGLYTKYGDKLDVLAVSIDEKSANWKKAMEEEKMEWTQLILPANSVGKMMSRFSINAIPALMVLNPAGEVVLLTNSSDEISDYLRKNI